MEKKAQVSRGELLAMVSAMMAFMAMGVDVMLPAFGDIRADYGLAESSSATTRVVTFYFFGVAFGHLFYGPLADRLGRKPTLVIATVIYLVGVVMSSLAPTFDLLLAGRVVWGVGAAGGRVVSMAVVRDAFDGDAMAKAMSQVMAVFLLVPIIAPSLGAGLMLLGPWRIVFWFCGAFALIVLAWSLRLVETLNPADRRPLNVSAIVGGYWQVARTPITFGFTVGAIFLQAAFTGYLSSAELVVSDILGRGAQFPLIFGAVSILFGVAAVVNGRIVERLGVDGVLVRGAAAVVLLAGLLMVVTLALGGQPDFWIFMPMLAVTLSCFVFLMPNMNSAAMQPLGAIAGSGSALTGAARIAIGAFIGGFIGEAVSTSVTPLAVGVATMSVMAAATIFLTRAGGVKGLASR